MRCIRSSTSGAVQKTGTYCSLLARSPSTLNTVAPYKLGGGGGASRHQETQHPSGFVPVSANASASLLVSSIERARSSKFDYRWAAQAPTYTYNPDAPRRYPHPSTPSCQSYRLPPSMDGLQASSSATQSSLSAPIVLPSAYTEPSPELPNISAYGQQLDSFSPSDTMFSEESSEIVHSDGTGLQGGLRQLPLELRSMIMTYVLDTREKEDCRYGLLWPLDPSPSPSPSRRWLSKLSLVCRSWCCTLRPRLFENLDLRSQSDVYFLDSMLRQPQSGWLSAAVKRLYLNLGLDSRMDLERILLVLSKKLPSLQELHHHPASNKLDFLRPCLLPSLQRYSNLRVLELRNIKVSSFSLLVKLLGSIPRLENLDCNNVSWIHQDPVEGPPARMAPFLHLSQIEVKGGYSSAPTFLWLFYPMISRRYSPSSANIENHDTMLMAMIAKAVCRTMNTACADFLLLTYYSGRNELSVRDAFDDPILTFELWPVAPATLNNICSVIRIVKVTLRWDTYLDRDNAEWETVDTLFAQKATSIEAFSIAIMVVLARISIKTIRSRVRSCFPRLVERGVVRMRIQDRNEILHDWHTVHPVHESGSESTSNDLGDPSDSSDPDIWDDLSDSSDSNIWGDSNIWDDSNI